jgi:hypothetical protein
VKSSRIVAGAEAEEAHPDGDDGEAEEAQVVGKEEGQGDPGTDFTKLHFGRKLSPSSFGHIFAPKTAETNLTEYYGQSFWIFM